MNTPQIVFACAVSLAFVSGCDRDPPASNTSTNATGGPAAPPIQPKGAAAADVDTEAKVIAIVAEQMGVRASDLKRSTHLNRDLKADELDRVELVMELEDQFDLSIDDEAAEKFLTVGEVIDYVRTHRGTPSKRPRDPKPPAPRGGR